ncbi:DUF1330 domain-containing protein [Nocardia sp. CC227C]|uniref:DUF1330 domain-containing protein n=1 Tax=Nocardia sp. CC227C TaxID=3044562 RepID=UPI00278C83F7|nr:DUF1330 domain-containing protein [Nocardia sp. CC227C]
MTAYAVAHIHDLDLNADIVEYLERIDETLAPFGGRFLVHGGRQQATEGPEEAFIVILEFPEYDRAVQWYDSPAYQAILPLRLKNSVSVAVLADGCRADHRSTDLLTELGLR